MSMAEIRGAGEVLGGGGGGSLKERDHLEYLGVDGSIILESMLKKAVERVWTGLIWLRNGTGGVIVLNGFRSATSLLGAFAKL